MSCFGAELQALQLLLPNSASGIARAFPSFLLYIVEFPDSRCGPLVSVSDNLNPFQRCRGGKHKLCTYGAGMAKTRWTGTLSYAKTTNLSRSIFSGTPSTPCRAPPGLLAVAADENTVSKYGVIYIVYCTHLCLSYPF